MFSILGNKLKKWLPKTLISRFALIIIIPTILGQMVTVQLFYYRHWYNVSSYSSKIIATEIAALLDEVKFDKIKEESLRDKPLKFLNLQYEKYQLDTLPEFSGKMLEEIEIFRDTLANYIELKTSLAMVDRDRTVELYVQLDDNNIVKITLPAKAIINPSATVFVIWIIGLGLILIIITLIFTKNQIRSILDLTNAAETYGSGHNIDNFKPSGAKEIRRAGLAFLKMKDRIERQTAKRTQMLAMISHDLKTPLTRMKLQAELMDESDEKEEMNYDITCMSHMIESYLDFARGEGGEQFIQVNLTDWMQEYLKNNWQKKVRFQSGKSTNNKIKAMIKPLSFSRALSNLIDNANKHSSAVELSLYQDDENIVIIIEDNGKGISDEDKRNVFKPFYRGDKSRSLDSSSSVGLGLAITREIIAGHYGTISLKDSTKLGGLLVRIELPIDHSTL